MNRRRILALPFALAASGCAARLELPPMSEERIKSVVILTSFTDTVHLKWTRFFKVLFSGTSEDEFVKVNWGVDNHVRTRLAERLAGKCEIKTVTYSPADLAARDRFETRPQIIERLKRVVPSGLADVIIFINGSGVPFDKLTHAEKFRALIGTGMIGGYNPFMKDGTVAHAFAHCGVAILDGRTFETVASRAGAVARSGHDVPAPIERVPFSYAGGPWAGISEEERTQLRETTFRLLDKIVTYTFGPHVDGVDKPPDGLATASTAEFATLQARDAKRWNAVMARLGLPSTP